MTKITKKVGCFRARVIVNDVKRIFAHILHRLARTRVTSFTKSHVWLWNNSFGKRRLSLIQDTPLKSPIRYQLEVSLFKFIGSSQVFIHSLLSALNWLLFMTRYDRTSMSRYGRDCCWLRTWLTIECFGDELVSHGELEKTGKVWEQHQLRSFAFDKTPRASLATSIRQKIFSHFEELMQIVIYRLSCRHVSSSSGWKSLISINIIRWFLLRCNSCIVLNRARIEEHNSSNMHDTLSANIWFLGFPSSLYASSHTHKWFDRTQNEKKPQKNRRFSASELPSHRHSLSADGPRATFEGHTVHLRTRA